MPRNFTSPVGRIVQGDVFEPNLTDQAGRPRLVQSGPRAGQPSPQYYIALAYAKNDPAWPAHKAEIDAESAAAWPSLFPGGPGSPPVLPTFANKIIDGDGYDTTGKSNAAKEGFANHWIVRYTSGFPIKAYRPNGPGVWIEVTDKTEIKRGYYVRVSGNIETNGQATKPGVYVNARMVELNGVGPEIVGGVAPSEAFGAPAALPAGAALPPPTAAPAPLAPPPAVPLAPTPVAPAPVAPPAVPYAGFMPLIATATMPAGQTVETMKAAGWTDDLLVQHGHATRPVAAPPAVPAAPPTPPPAGPTMTEKAAGVTREAMLGQGWTDAQLIQHGYMVA